MFGELDTRAPVILEPPETLQEHEWGRRHDQPLNLNLDARVSITYFREFFRNFKIDNIFIYRESLLKNWNRRELFIDVDLDHLNEFNQDLFNHLLVSFLSLLAHSTCNRHA